jgi:hypothetical protein
MSIPYAYSEKLIEDPDDKDSTLVPLAPLTASLSCSLIGQKDGTFTLDSELEVAAGPAHSHFTLLAATDVDLSSLVLKDYDDYIKVAKDISGDSKYSGNASYILPFTSPDNVEQKTRLTVWALEQSAADGVSHQTVPQLIASCEVEPKALDDILLEEGEIDDLGDADLVELEGEAAQKKIVK